MKYSVNPYVKIDHQNIFFTSDFHLGHKNVIKFDNRPFENVRIMTDTIIENWNSVVNDESIVYFLGDLFFRGSQKRLKEIVHSLKGEIRVILGNHDRLSKLASLERFSDIQTYQRISVKDSDGRGGNQDIIVAHYPILSWDKYHFGSWHIHGHCHMNLTKTQTGEEYYRRKVIDVGCNGWNYTPVSYEKVKEIMNTKECITIDHH